VIYKYILLFLRGVLFGLTEGKLLPKQSQAYLIRRLSRLETLAETIIFFEYIIDSIFWIVTDTLLMHERI